MSIIQVQVFCMIIYIMLNSVFVNIDILSMKQNKNGQKFYYAEK